MEDKVLISFRQSFFNKLNLRLFACTFLYYIYIVYGNQLLSRIIGMIYKTDIA